MKKIFAAMILASAVSSVFAASFSGGTGAGYSTATDISGGSFASSGQNGKGTSFQESSSAGYGVSAAGNVVGAGYVAGATNNAGGAIGAQAGVGFNAGTSYTTTSSNGTTSGSGYGESKGSVGVDYSGATSSYSGVGYAY